MPADLHIHTYFSDGSESPEAVVELAKKAGLTAIAITDHDVVSGIERAAARGRELGLEVIPGIEFTTEAYDSEIHILGYFIDIKEPRLLEKISRMQKGREERVFKICEKLKELGAPVDPEKVFTLAGHRAAGRPHVARALIEAGHVRNFREAFNKYLAFHSPAYVSHYKLMPTEAVELIGQAKGLAVYGHPAVSACDGIVPELASAGLAGIEVYYSGHDESQTKHYEELARKHGLLMTGGSDFHGSNGGREINLGDIMLPDDLLARLKDEHLRRNRS
ncbi:MAG: PHP domain-containing protein [Candidatus Saganbacteria bacterium]|nr:PHP domain-containing protein [Candidatus Saganbacteria bacterium]